MLIVGLTGGVASGKSTISRILKEEGAYLIDADQIAKELVQPNTPAWKELVRVFGKEILQENGAIHRKKLADRVFSDSGQRERLNQILHPWIREETDHRVKKISRKDPEAIIVVDAALLVETGDYRGMDKLIVVASTETQQIERLQKRDGVSADEARRILSAQLPLEEKLKVADFVIHNDGTIEETRRMTKEIFGALKKIALQRRESPEP